MLHHSVFRDLLVYPDDSLSDYLGFSCEPNSYVGTLGSNPR